MVLMPQPVAQGKTKGGLQGGSGDQPSTVLGFTCFGSTCHRMLCSATSATVTATLQPRAEAKEVMRSWVAGPGVSVGDRVRVWG